ncbi:hypothetical protein [Nioella nitratireducens]|uniref:hypothetical protein n=1 Tax=Nioella nitratireducens TaxID=1287720 RepID=UPI0008FD84AE|nr:hypothetical protein [Nioella nitratireducens]
MSSSRQWHRYRPSRVELLSYGAIAIAIGVYFTVLNVLDGRAEAYFETLREEDPALYLSQLRESRSFAAYVDEYRVMQDYDTFHPAAPDFLVGRWTMREEPLRLTPGTVPSTCSDPVTFDYGILLMLDGSDLALRVNYAIEEQRVLLNAPGIDVFPVDLISYGARLDHIEFQPPGRANRVYAYICSR